MRYLILFVISLLIFANNLYSKNVLDKHVLEFDDSDFIEPLPNINRIENNTNNFKEDNLNNSKDDHLIEELNRVINKDSNKESEKNKYPQQYEYQNKSNNINNGRQDILSNFIRNIEEAEEQSDNFEKVNDSDKTKVNNVYIYKDSMILEATNFRLVCEKLIEDEMFLCKQYMLETKPIVHEE